MHGTGRVKGLRREYYLSKKDTNNILSPVGLESHIKLYYVGVVTASSLSFESYAGAPICCDSVLHDRWMCAEGSYYDCNNSKITNQKYISKIFKKSTLQLKW